MREYKSTEVITIGSWVGIIILLSIPIVNVIAVLYLAFGSDNENLNNFGKAMLIIFGIGLLIALLLSSCSAIL